MTIEKPLLVVIAGPTASGKTAQAIRLANQFNIEIISCDSRQFYRELNIGTAKPTPDELAAAPHHFVGHLSIFDSYNVSRFESDALKLLNELFAKHSVVIMAGGSGLYIDAVCKGIDILPDPDPEVRQALKAILHRDGIEALRRELQQFDPEYAREADLANPARLIRALEIFRTTGIPYSSMRRNQVKERPFCIQKFCLDIPRETLNQRINQRVDQMMEDGLLDEARALYPHRHLNALNTVGYKELFDHFDGLSDLPCAIEKIKTNTRRYAKRQVTWLRRDGGYGWMRPEQLAEITEVIDQGV
jgi:tRNA dimethylallyltransferase